MPVRPHLLLFVLALSGLSVADDLNPLLESSLRPDAPAQVMETIEGIPIHRVAVPNLEHESAGIELDGLVKERVWSTLPAYDNMIVSVPGTGEVGHFPTHMRMFATEKGLYVSAVMEQPPDTLVARLSNRDDFIDRDTFGFTLDPSGEGKLGYWFIIGLGDSKMDGKVLPERNYQLDWDGPWLGKSATLSNGWSAEMFLPWSMMNMPDQEGARIISFAVSRQVSHENERYQWPGHPYASSRFLTALNTFTVEGVEPAQQFSIIPYSSATVDKARDETRMRLGADLSWKPSSRLELTASILPDFGAVEADHVVLNLTAQETFFPEKRLFFLEGNEVFNTTPRSNPGNAARTITNDNFATTSRQVFSSQFMPAPVSLMNSRRIGGTATQVDVPDGVDVNRGETERPTDLLGASKVTGTVGDLRYGVLAAIEDDVEWLGTTDSGVPVDITGEGRNFGIARFTYENVGADRKSIGYMGTFVSGALYDAVVHGVDLHYTSSGGNLIIDSQLLASDVDDVQGKGGLIDLYYSASPRIQHKFEIDYFDETAQINDLGFLRRNDYTSAQYALLYNNTKGTEKIKDIRGTIVARQQYNVSKGQVTDSGLFWRNSMVLPGRNTVKTALGFLPERYEDWDSRGNGSYRTVDRLWWDVLLATDAAKMFSYSFNLDGLQENLGGWTYTVGAGVTVRPSDRISVDLDMTYRRRQGWVVYQGGRNFGTFDGPELAPKVQLNWFMSPGHQLRFTLQWVGVKAENKGFWAVPEGDGDLIPAARVKDSYDFTVSLLTAQIRYRWEIAPLTDFYLVYNHSGNLPNQINSSTSDLFTDTIENPLEKSFIAKLRYRFGN